MLVTSKTFVVQHRNHARIMRLRRKGVEEIGDAVNVPHGCRNAFTQRAEAEAGRGHLGQAKLGPEKGPCANCDTTEKSRK